MQKLGNEYVLMKLLGSGGYADVYKARHIRLGYVRAIRILKQFVPDEESPLYQGFLRECRVLLRLGNGCHPNIVHIYQPRLVEGKPLVEMDYVDGIDLRQYIAQQGGRVPVEEIVRMVREIGSALAYCHHDIYKVCFNRDEDHLQDDPDDGDKVIVTPKDERRLIAKYRVIHNDIHTGNIMRRHDGLYMLLDFGLAVDGDSDVVGSSRKEQGAIEFKSPERAEGMDPTPQDDIYSFGCVMYAMITGAPPFQVHAKGGGLSPAELSRVLMAHKTQAPPPIEREDVPQWLKDLTLRCLEKEPAKRYSDAYEMYEEIRRHSEEPQVDMRRMEALEAENKGLAAELTAAQASHDEVQKQYESLQHDFTEITRNFQKEKDELKEKNEELGNRIVELGQHGKADGHRPKWGVVVLLLLLCAAVGAGAMALLKKGGGTAVPPGYEDSLASLSSLREDNAAKQNQITQLQDSLAVARRDEGAQLEELRNRLSAFEREIANKESIIAALEREKSRLEKNNTQLGKDKAELERQVRNLNNQKNTLAKEKQKVEDRLSEYITTFGPLKKKK